MKKEKEKFVLSYGGGLNSSALLVWLVENKKPLDLMIFSDTGSEFDYTYKAIEYYKKYCKEKGIEFVAVKSNLSDSLYNYCKLKNIIPSRMKRDCTSKFKISPIRKYLRERFGKKQKFVMYIGITSDEFKRVRESDVKYIQNQYPFVDVEEIDRQGCIDFLKERNLFVPDKSGCWFCPFTKKGNWIRLLNENPVLFDKAIELEEQGSRFPEFLFNSIPLRKLKEDYKNQTRLVNYEPTCDVSGSCFL